MNLYQCQEKAKDVGFDTARFIALFPSGPVECQWIDAYMGVLKLDIDGFRNNFVMTRQLDDNFPSLECSDFRAE